MSTLKRQRRPEDSRQHIPSVSVVLEHRTVKQLLNAHPRPLVLDAIRQTLDCYRTRNATVALDGGRMPRLATAAALDIDAIANHVVEHFENAERERLRPVINGTGIILHTGLGRAVLPARAAKALAQLDRCCNLQIDLETGERGKRNYMTEQLLCRLTGAEAAMVVNNNAAATMLVLVALCAGKEVIVSRGQLIEIGGSFRLPDCVHQSGAKLIEVGTTNKTHLRDYAAALTDDTAAILRVNPSNYRVVGFSKSVSIEELVTLKDTRPVLIIDDLGCGALVNLEQYGLPHEPMVQESMAAGADLACFSGDKLIGGPQAGIIVGRKELIARIKKHPLTRMLRIDKLADMALEQTLRLFLEPDKLIVENPTLRMLAAPVARVKQRAKSLKRMLKHVGPLECAVESVSSATGGGSLPDVPIPSFALVVSMQGVTAGELARRLRRNEPPIVTRIHEGRVMIDLRTVLEGEEKPIAQALTSIADQHIVKTSTTSGSVPEQAGM